MYDLLLLLYSGKIICQIVFPEKTKKNSCRGPVPRLTDGTDRTDTTDKRGRHGKVRVCRNPQISPCRIDSRGSPYQSVTIRKKSSRETALYFFTGMTETPSGMTATFAFFPQQAKAFSKASSGVSAVSSFMAWSISAEHSGAYMITL